MKHSKAYPYLKALLDASIEAAPNWAKAPAKFVSSLSEQLKDKGEEENIQLADEISKISRDELCEIIKEYGCTQQQNIEYIVEQVNSIPNTLDEINEKQDSILDKTEENNQLLKSIHEQLVKKHIEESPQLINELKKKYETVVKELNAYKTEDKRAKDALVAFKDGNYEKAKKLFESQREEEEKREKEHAETAYNLGNVYFVELDFQKALDAYLDAVRLAPDNSIYLYMAGYTFDRIAQYDKAIEYFGKALKFGLKNFGEDHPNVTIILGCLGDAWKEKGEYDKAIECFEKALKFGLKTFGEDHPNVAALWNNLGSAWQEKGEYDKAIEYYEKALMSDLNTFGEDHPNVAIYRNNLGNAWHAKGECDKAIEYFEKALKSNLKTFGEDDPQVAISWSCLGDAWKAKSEYNKAIEYYEKALVSFKNCGILHHVAIIEEYLKDLRKQKRE